MKLFMSFQELKFKRNNDRSSFMRWFNKFLKSQCYSYKSMKGVWMLRQNRPRGDKVHILRDIYEGEKKKKKKRLIIGPVSYEQIAGILWNLTLKRQTFTSLAWHNKKPLSNKVIHGMVSECPRKGQNNTYNTSSWSTNRSTTLNITSSPYRRHN